ncbi:MAG: hypothetical protein ACFFD4_01870 [Candidatus Odinarchaeota archaeon]
MQLESLSAIERAEAKKKSVREEFFRRTSLMKSCETSNEFLVASYLLDGPATRGDIVKNTHVKWTTAHDSLVRLQIKGIVKREIVPRGRGRPLVLWSLVA